MAYEVHIERTNGEPIFIEEWVKAIGRVENVRLAEAAATNVTTPAIDEQISNPQMRGIAELFDLRSQTWLSVLRWSKGRISTRASRDFDTFSNYQRSVLRALSSQLDAQIVGDEGETYD